MVLKVLASLCLLQILQLLEPLMATLANPLLSVIQLGLILWRKELLRQRIFARELEPGSWIDELRIAEALGISRTPLREALKVLAAEGLVTMKVRRGAYVTEVSEKDLRDVYHLLALLESDAARVVAQRATDAQMAQIHALHQDLAKATDNRDRFFEINEAFHMLLMEIADNPDLLKLIELGILSEETCDAVFGKADGAGSRVWYRNLWNFRRNKENN